MAREQLACKLSGFREQNPERAEQLSIPVEQLSGRGVQQLPRRGPRIARLLSALGTERSAERCVAVEATRVGRRGFGYVWNRHRRRRHALAYGIPAWSSTVELHYWLKIQQQKLTAEDAEGRGST
jgi:hypothetical protein